MTISFMVSDWRDGRELDHPDYKPCAKAEWRSYVRRDTRIIDDPSKVPMHLGNSEWWYEKGRNHRIVDGNICRDFDDKSWFIDIKSLDEMICLHKEVGVITITSSPLAHDFLILEFVEGYNDF